MKRYPRTLVVDKLPKTFQTSFLVSLNVISLYWIGQWTVKLIIVISFISSGVRVIKHSVFCVDIIVVGGSEKTAPVGDRVWAFDLISITARLLIGLSRHCGHLIGQFLCHYCTGSVYSLSPYNDSPNPPTLEISVSCLYFCHFALYLFSFDLYFFGRVATI